MIEILGSILGGLLALVVVTAIIMGAMFWMFLMFRLFDCLFGDWLF